MRRHMIWAVFGVLVPLLGALGCRSVQASPSQVPLDVDGGMPLLSRNLPAFASHHASDASKAFDADYGTTWRSAHDPTSSDPDWLAIDLSTVPRARRETIYSVWFNEAGYAYDISDGHGYALAGDYQIQSNGAPGGSGPPKSGWVSVASRTGNTLSSGAHLLHLTDANWLRFLCTKTTANAAAMNTDTSLQWDLYDAHQSVDGWKFGGDSITANAMGHKRTNDSFNQLVAKEVPRFPAFEMAGHGGWGTTQFLPVIDAYLADFPGRYFALSLGTNDGDAGAFATNMNALITKVLAAGKIPIVPTIPYTGEPAHLAVIPRLNLAIAKLYETFGARLVRGPDLYAILFAGRDKLFDHPTDLHPNAAGDLAIRKAWADAMVKAVYH